ncbi:MAG: phage holin family protein [Minisyncoccia bacterium]|jgi:hypothetical protein
MKETTDDDGEILSPLLPPKKNGSLFARTVGRLSKGKRWVLGIVMAILAGGIVLLIAAAIFVVHLLSKVKVVDGGVNWTFVIIASLVVFLIGMLLATYLAITVAKAIWRIITSETRDEGGVNSRVPSTNPTIDKPETSIWRPVARTVVFVVGLLLLLIFLFYLGLYFVHLGDSKSWSPEKNQTTSAGTTQVRLSPYINQVCDDALDGPAPVATTHESLTDNIPQGCFGSDTRIDWQSWCYQPYPRNPIAPDWQVTFQFLDGEGRVWATKGPYGPMDKPSFQYFPGRFRLQGSGIIRFYPGNCT